FRRAESKITGSRIRKNAGGRPATRILANAATKDLVRINDLQLADVDTRHGLALVVAEPGAAGLDARGRGLGGVDRVDLSRRAGHQSAARHDGPRPSAGGVDHGLSHGASALASLSKRVGGAFHSVCGAGPIPKHEHSGRSWPQVTL